MLLEPDALASHRLLVVDDEPEIRDLVSAHLERAGHRSSTAANVAEARTALARGRFDLVVLDVMMPGGSGLDLCAELAGQGGPPVILLTAVADESARVAGLDLGADDYIAKPFGPDELLARVRAVLRRAGAPPPARRLRFAGWTFDTLRGELLGTDGVTVPLSTGEVRLLGALLARPGAVLSRDELMRTTRGREAPPLDRTIDNAVARLRRKIEPDPTRPGILRTVRGGGYALACEVAPL